MLLQGIFFPTTHDVDKYFNIFIYIVQLPMLGAIIYNI